MTDQEYKARMDALMPVLESRRHGKKEIEEMFLLYNLRLTPREQRSTCGACIARVFKRMQTYYAELCRINTNQ